MPDDVAPALLEEIRRDFAKNLGGRKRATELLQLIRGGSATYVDAGAYAQEVGSALSEAFRANISSAALPEGKMYRNIAERVVQPMLQEDHRIIAEAAKDVQKSLNEAAGLGLAPQEVPLNKSRVDGILNRLTYANKFDDIAWILGEPIINFSQSIIDESIKRNVDFQGRSGLQPRVVRRVKANCCEWCENLDGSYTYPSVPDDVYRRHERCRCTVEYMPSSGRRQDVWTKEWQESADVLQARREFTGLDTSPQLGTNG